MAHSTLVIIPCGQQKIWTKTPAAGPTLARDAYTSSPFRVNRAFAEKFGDKWLILSAKYGFVEPDFRIPEAYNVTFKDSRIGPISRQQLGEQVRRRRLGRFTTVIGLGGRQYREAVEQAFAHTAVRLRFPFSGLPIGKAMQAAKRAIAANDPFGAARLITTEDVCGALHQWLSQRTAFGFPYPTAEVPRSGIYVLFEVGEAAHGANRIVRIGTHTGDNQLRSRLTQHFLHENKDRSIFRKNIGRCLLNRNKDPYLSLWELDLTTRDARMKHGSQLDSKKQEQVERQVSEYIRGRFRFAVLAVADKSQRLELESKIVSCVSLCGTCGPSSSWLGQHSPVAKIQKSGLWQVNELYKTPLSAPELQELLQIADVR